MQFHTKLKTTSTGNNTFVFIPHTKPNKLPCKSIQISGSGRIVHLISGDIRFWPDFKNCYPEHPYYKIHKIRNDSHTYEDVDQVAQLSYW